MQLESVRVEAAGNPETAWMAASLEQSLGSVDDCVKQIRAIVHALREPDAAVGLVERLRREASLARTGLSSAPSLVISVDGALEIGRASCREGGERRAHGAA